MKQFGTGFLGPPCIHKFVLIPVEPLTLERNYLHPFEGSQLPNTVQCKITLLPPGEYNGENMKELLEYWGKLLYFSAILN